MFQTPKPRRSSVTPKERKVLGRIDHNAPMYRSNGFMSPTTPLSIKKRFEKIKSGARARLSTPRIPKEASDTWSVLTDVEGEPLVLNYVEDVLQWKYPMQSIICLVVLSFIYFLHHFMGYSFFILVVDIILVGVVFRTIQNKFWKSNQEEEKAVGVEEIELPFDVDIDGLMLDVLFLCGSLHQWWNQMTQVQISYWYTIKNALYLLGSGLLMRLLGVSSFLYLLTLYAYAHSLYNRVRFQEEQEDDDLAQDLFHVRR